MQIRCPHCHAIYRLGEVDETLLLVCHRCGHEFHLRAPEESPADEETPSPRAGALPLFEHSAGGERPSPEEPEAAAGEPSPPAGEGDDRPDDGPPTPREVSARADGGDDEAAVEMRTDRGTVASGSEAPPRPRQARIWPWLLLILSVIAGAGLWYNQERWLGHPWTRSILLNLHAPLNVRGDDWLVAPESVRAQWIPREGGRVLVVEGTIRNRLYAELPPPRLLVRFFRADRPSQPIAERIVPITRPPGIEKIRRVPYTPPPVDRVPVAAQGSRGFVLVFESLPDGVGDFTLEPVVRRADRDTEAP